MITAAASQTSDIAEELLEYFVRIGNKECFTACLFVCYDLIRPDVVEDLQWRQYAFCSRLLWEKADEAPHSLPVLSTTT